MEDRDSYFISPDDKLISISIERHVLMIMHYPEKFGLTDEDVNNVLRKYTPDVGPDKDVLQYLDQEGYDVVSYEKGIARNRKTGREIRIGKVVKKDPVIQKKFIDDVSRVAVKHKAVREDVREELLNMVVRRGWIRIRIHRGEGPILIQTGRMNKKIKEQIWDFANKIIDGELPRTTKISVNKKVYIETLEQKVEWEGTLKELAGTALFEEATSISDLKETRTVYLEYISIEDYVPLTTRQKLLDKLVEKEEKK